MPLPEGFDAGRRLGRRPEPDWHNANYPVRTLLEDIGAKTPRGYSWTCDLKLDQGNHGTCVGNAITDELDARPVVVGGLEEDFAVKLYLAAGGILDDQHPEREGASVLGGMKAAAAMGYYSEYRWAFSLEDLVLTVGYLGPVVLGINWYQQMFDPDASGLISIGGSIAGGHAILNNAVKLAWTSLSLPGSRTFTAIDSKRSRGKLHNSWGQGWALNGECWISLEDLDRLIHEGGDVAVPVSRTHPHTLGLLDDEEEAPAPEADQSAQEDDAPASGERPHRVPRAAAPNRLPAYGTVV